MTDPKDVAELMSREAFSNWKNHEYWEVAGDAYEEAGRQDVAMACRMMARMRRSKTNA